MNHRLKIWKSIKAHKFTPFLLALIIIASGTGLTPASAQKQDTSGQDQSIPASSSLVTWPVFDGSSSRSGVNKGESQISSATIGRLGRQWQITMSETDSSPIELPDAQTNKGIKPLLFLTTKTGELWAIDARSGKQVWRRNTSGPRYTTSSPALDPSHKFVYSYGLDGKVHKYSIFDGHEIKNNGWPEIVTLMPDVEKGSSALNIGNGYLYVTIGGYPGDGGHYTGHVVAIRLSDGKKRVFNTECANLHMLLGTDSSKPNYCPDTQSAVWGRGGAVIDPVTGHVFIATGNGDFNANVGGHNYGDSIIELKQDLSSIIDTYTPSDYANLQANDADLGSAVPAMLPRQAGSKTPYMLVQASKDYIVRLINRQNLSGHGGPNHLGGAIDEIRLPQDCPVVTHPVAWNDHKNVTWVFIADFCGFVAYKITTDSHGHSHFKQIYANGNGGSSPFIANNILYVQGDHDLMAMNPTSGHILWQTTQASAGGTIGSLHWQSPLIANGHIYVIDDDQHFTAYKLR